MSAKQQRAALIAAIQRNFPDAKLECSELPWLRVPKISPPAGPLGVILTALQSHRGHASFATEGRKLLCDIVIPSQRLIIEYDERQHFSLPRAIALRLYPKDLAIGFDRAEWIAHCEAIAAADNDPPYRDEQRAYYDSVRDILAAANGYRVTRLKNGAIDWVTRDADGEILKCLSIKRQKQRSAVQPSPRLVTVCVEGQPVTHCRDNHRRLELLADVVAEINRRWENLDAVVFPGGFLRLDECIGHLGYKDRIRKLKSAGLVDPIKKIIRVLKRSPGALIVFGVDGPRYSNGDWGDQLCVAADVSGIVGIGRKIFPVAGSPIAESEAGNMLCYDADFAEAHRVVRLPNGSKAMLSACYDMFGVAELGEADGTRARGIRWIGTFDDQVERGTESFEGKLQANLARFRKLIQNNVTVGIAAIHYFPSHSTAYWQKHGIAACSAALDSGFSVGAAHFRRLPKTQISSALAASQVPIKHLQQGIHREAHAWDPRDSFQLSSERASTLVRLFYR